jgi:hypothetical protein
MKPAKATDHHFSVREASEKLKKVWYDSLPKWVAYPYTLYFINYLNEEYLMRSEKEVMYAEDLLLAVQLAFSDLRRGFNGTTGKMITHRAADRVPSTEIFVRLDLLKVWDLVFTPEFATEVKRVKKALEAEAQKLVAGKEKESNPKAKQMKARKR